MKTRRTYDSPCVECEHQEKCKYDLKACKPYRLFVNTGNVFLDAPRQPTRKIYLDIFHPEKD